jgi:hypothetical protein
LNVRKDVFSVKHLSDVKVIETPDVIRHPI